MTEDQPQDEFPEFDGYNQCLMLLEQGELTLKKMKKLIPKDDRVLRTLVSHQMAFVTLFEQYVQDGKLGRAMKTAQNVTLDSHRHAFLERIDALLEGRIQKHLEANNTEKAKKWISRLTSDEMRSKWCKVLNTSSHAEPVTEPAISNVSIDVRPVRQYSLPVSREADSPNDAPELSVARGILVEKIGDALDKFSEPVIAELTHLIAQYWLPKDWSTKKVKCTAVNRTVLLILGVLLSEMTSESLLVPEKIAEKLDITEKSVLREMDFLRKSLKNTDYQLIGKKPKDGFRLLRKSSPSA